MIFPVETYGYDPETLLTSHEEVWNRLTEILSDKTLRFNPYNVTDSDLLACAERGRWKDFPSLTQMVVFHFHQLEKIKWKRTYDAIVCHIGDDSNELHIPVSTLTRDYTYLPTRRSVHSTLNNRPITNFGMVEKMQNRDFFVSHALYTRRIDDKVVPAYRLYRLKGSPESRADTIRKRMVEAKIGIFRK